MYRADPSPTIAIPMSEKRTPDNTELCFGKMCVPTSINVAIRTMFESVPNPGLSLSGIQMRSTKMLMTKVAHPILSPVL
jgi:hypothetical protein